MQSYDFFQILTIDSRVLKQSEFYNSRICFISLQPYYRKSSTTILYKYQFHKMGVSLKDIAAKLGISKTTVSWVLSGQGDKRNISTETQERVRACAKELNYSLNGLARSLNLGYTKTIGLILPSISDSFYANIANRVELVANASGYSLMIASSKYNADKEEELIRLFVEKQVDGIILAPMKLTQESQEYIQFNKVPLVFIDRNYEDLETSYVIIDNKDTSRILVDNMIRLDGCRRVALVTCDPHMLTMDGRRCGYETALLENSIDIDPSLCLSVHIASYKDELPEALEKFISSNDDIDGFFFTTHILLEETIKFFCTKGIDIGRYKMASMRTNPFLEFMVPYLRVAHFPENEMGKKAVEILLNHIESRQKGEPWRNQEVTLNCSFQ